MSWNLEGSSGNKNKAEWTKFPVGITRIRVIDDAPSARWTHWLNQHKRSVNCPGRGCPICDIRKQQKANKEPYTYNMTRRFAINILNRDTRKVEIMEQGINFFEDLRDLMEDLKAQGKTLLDVDIRVKRRGTGKDDTSYRLDLDEEYPLTEEDKSLMENKVDLSEFFVPNTPEQILRLISGEPWDDVIKSDTSENDTEEEIELQ